MALIALEFETDRIIVASARAAGRRAKIQHLFSIDIDGSDEKVAESLKNALAQKGLSRSDAIIVVSRGNAEIRLMEVPPAPENELPDIVRFVARNEFASLNDNWLLDFVRLTGDQATTGQVLAAGVSPEMSNQIRAITEGAGLRLRHMVLRPFAAVDLMAERMDANSVHLLVDPNGEQTDLTIIDGTKVVATRTVRVAPDSDLVDRLVPEIRRTIASSNRALGGKPVNQIIVFGKAEESETVGEKLRNRLDIDVAFVDPLKHPVVSSSVSDVDQPSRFVALMGALVQQAGKDRHAIDFLNPRRQTKKQFNLLKPLIYIGIAALVLIGLAFFGWQTLANQEEKIAKKEKQLQELKTENKGDSKRMILSVDDKLKKVAKIDSWVMAQTDWQKQIDVYSQQALTADDSIVDVFTANIPSSKRPGRITVTARSADFKTEKNLVDSLSTKFVVTPSRSDSVEESKDYPILTNFDIDIDPNTTLDEINEKAKVLFETRAAQRIEAQKAKAENAESEPATPKEANP